MIYELANIPMPILLERLLRPEPAGFSHVCAGGQHRHSKADLPEGEFW